jgi:hypothetical protein
MKYEKEAYESLLDKVEQVFRDELDTLSETQEAVVNGLLEDRIQARGGDPSKVTLEEVEGVRELLYTQFSLAAALNGKV